MIIMITAIHLSLKVVIYPLHAVALSGFPTDLTYGGSGGRCHTEHWGQNSVGSSMYISVYHVSEACVIVSAKSQKCPSQTCNIIVSSFKSILNMEEMQLPPKKAFTWQCVYHCQFPHYNQWLIRISVVHCSVARTVHAIISVFG